MDLNIKRNNTGVYVTKRNWFISMTYDYSWVPKIQTFEGDEFEKSSYHRKWNLVEQMFLLR